MSGERRRGAYGAGLAATLAGTAMGLGAGVIGLWLLNRILPKEDFGGYAFAMNLLLLGTLVASLGLDRALLLRVAGLAEGDGTLRGRGLLGRAALWAGGASLGLAALAAALAPLLPAPNGWWLRALAPALPFLVLAFVLRAWLQANHRTGLSNLVPGLIDGGRALGLAAAWAGGAGRPGVAAAVALSAALPVAGILAAMAGPWRARTRRAPRRLAARDVARGMPFLVQTLSVQGMTLLDVVVVGLVAAGATTADYALAARLALLGDAPRQALKPTFTARARRHLATGDRGRLAREYHATRLAGTLAALGAAAALAAFGRPLLGLFGPFATAEPALLAMLAAGLVVGGAGMHTSVLSMGGELHASALVRAAGLALLALLVAALAPRMGALGAALGLLAAQGAVALGTGLLMRARSGLAPLPPGALLRLLAGVALLLLAAFGALPEPVAAALLLALAGLAAWVERAALADLRALVAGGAWRP